MTVSTTSNKIVYTGNAATTVWPFAFPGVASADLGIWFTDTNGDISLLDPSSYTIILNAATGSNPTGVGGSVTYPLAGAPIAAGTKLTIIRELDETQLTSFANQGTLYQKVIELSIDYLTMITQQLSEQLGRQLIVPVSDPDPGVLPTVDLRKSQWAFWDSDGNLGAGAAPGGAVPISAAMQPVVAALTLALARAAMGLGTMAVQNANAVAITGGSISGLSPPLAVASGGTGSANYGPIDGSNVSLSGAYGILNSDKRKTLVLGGSAFYTISAGVPGGFDNDYQIRLTNVDTGISPPDARGKLIDFNALPAFILYPGQTVVMGKVGGVWKCLSSPGRFYRTTGILFQVDYVLGSDSNDGLGTGSGAFKTIQHAVNVVQFQYDGLNGAPINIADNQVHMVGSGVLITGAVLGADQLQVTCNSGFPSGPASCVLQGDVGATIINVQDNGVAIAYGFLGTITGFGAGAIVSVRQEAIADIQVNYHLQSGGGHVNCTQASSLSFTGDYTIYGSVPVHLSCSNTAFINWGFYNVDIPAGCAFTVFLSMSNCGVVAGGGMTQTGAGAGGGSSGQRYSVAYNAVANVSSNGALPGNAAGATSFGGQYA